MNLYIETICKKTDYYLSPIYNTERLDLYF